MATNTNNQTESQNRPAIAVFVSGSGRSLTNLINRQTDGSLNATIALVVASRECKAANIARAANISTIVQTENANEKQVANWLDDANASLAVLAGYLKLLPIPAKYQGRVINIHPALLPPLGKAEFGGPGMHGTRVHQAILESGEQVSGCTVHHATSEYDRGDPILQSACPVLENDTADTLAARVFQLELEALPQAINTVLSQLNQNNPGGVHP